MASLPGEKIVTAATARGPWGGPIAKVGLRTRLGAPAVVIAVVATALSVVLPASADDAPPPPAAPTSTTPAAPPPDPYQAPTPAKRSVPKRSTPVVHSAPTVHRAVPSYSPPPIVRSAPVRSVPARRHVRSHAKIAARKFKRHAVHRAAPTKPVKVTFNPFARFVAGAHLTATTSDGGDRDRFLWLAGFAFAALAAAGLSLHVLSVRALT